jgi:DNA repair exonuclease SbcCD ATPase subunit
VEELKERLGAKINVVPTGKGYSKVEVVSGWHSYYSVRY